MNCKYSWLWLSLVQLIMFGLLLIYGCVSWHSVADGLSSSQPLQLSRYYHRHHRRRASKSRSTVRDNSAIDRPSSAGPLISCSKRHNTASVAVDNQSSISPRRSASADASRAAAEVPEVQPRVASASHAADIAKDTDSTAPEIIYQRRRKRAKKKTSVSGNEHQKAAGSQALSLWRHFLTATACTVC